MVSVATAFSRVAYPFSFAPDTQRPFLMSLARSSALSRQTGSIASKNSENIGKRFSSSSCSPFSAITENTAAFPRTVFASAFFDKTRTPFSETVNAFPSAETQTSFSAAQIMLTAPVSDGSASEKTAENLMPAVSNVKFPFCKMLFFIFIFADNQIRDVCMRRE